MYVTRPLSMYKKSPTALEMPPPEGPNSGVLVVLDEEAEPTCCFGTCKSHELKELPLPQNRMLKTRYTVSTRNGSHAHEDKVVFIPVINRPLSSNLYYAIQPRGSHIGEAFASSKEEDKATCCFCRCVRDVKPQPFDPKNDHQQFEILRSGWSSRGLFAKSVAPDGFPPEFLRRKGWTVVEKTARNFELGEAQGLDAKLRARLPDFNFSLSNKNSNPVIVGRWYVPFVFIKEGIVKDQMNRSVFYEMTLEQRWKQIFACNNEDDALVVHVDVCVEREVVSVGEIVSTGRSLVDGVMRFKSSTAASSSDVGLRSEIVERIEWEEERFGWIKGSEREGVVNVKRVEECGGGWRRFGCYVLVERFVLKRLDGSLVLTYDFNHTQHIRTRWE